jgi:lysophospholipase L1-like esterase
LKGPIAVLLGTLAVVPVFSVVSMVGARVIPDDITAGLDENEEAVTRITTTIPNSQSTIPGVTTTTTAPVPKGKIDVLAVGDSVMLGAAKKLSSYGLTVDAEKNRQVLYAKQIFRYYLSKDELGDNVVIHLGTNGTTKASTFDAILGPLKDVKRVLVLNIHVPSREYQKINNKIINALPERWSNVTVLDWYGFSNPHPEWFAKDKVHLNAVGQDNYVAFILQGLGR